MKLIIFNLVLLLSFKCYDCGSNTRSPSSSLAAKGDLLLNLLLGNLITIADSGLVGSEKVRLANSWIGLICESERRPELVLPRGPHRMSETCPGQTDRWICGYS